MCFNTGAWTRLRGHWGQCLHPCVWVQQNSEAPYLVSLSPLGTSNHSLPSLQKSLKKRWSFKMTSFPTLPRPSRLVWPHGPPCSDSSRPGTCPPQEPCTCWVCFWNVLPKDACRALSLLGLQVFAQKSSSPGDFPRALCLESKPPWFLRKLKRELLYSNPTPRYLSKGNKTIWEACHTCYLKGHLYCHVYCSLFTIAEEKLSAHQING